MKKIINLYKPQGLTPLQAMKLFKSKYHTYYNKKSSYAGRLDPMAEGVLLILIAEENKKINQYMKLPKTYQAEILFNFSSDTHDILGIPNKQIKKIDINYLKKEIKHFQGKYKQKIPLFSSYKIKGKPLFHYARLKKKVLQPESTVLIKKIIFNKIYFIKPPILLKMIIRKINKVDGDFRQTQILRKWNTLLSKEKNKFLIFNLTINCSSGTYIRAIAEDIGRNYGGGLLLSLKRTNIGRFSYKNAFRLKK